MRLGRIAVVPVICHSGCCRQRPHQLYHCQSRLCATSSSAATTRATGEDTFTSLLENFHLEWGMKKEGVFFDAERIELRTTEDRGHGLFVKSGATVSPGELLVIVPHTSTIQASRCLDSTMQPLLDRFASQWSLNQEDKNWWELTAAMCYQWAKGKSSRYYPYLQYCLPNKSPVDPASIFAAYGHEIDPSRMMNLMKSREDKLKSFYETVICHHDGFLLVSSSPLPSLAEEGKGSTSSSLGEGEGRRISYERLVWAFDMVSSRANNFSFVDSTESLRPYGVYGTTPPGALPTMCPYFDIMNHHKNTNVLVADILTSLGDPQGDQTDELASLSMPSLAIGTLMPMQENTELCYAYNAPMQTMGGKEVVDKEEALLRWGFVPR